MSNVKPSARTNNSNFDSSTNVTMNHQQSVLNAVQLDQLLALLSFTEKNQNRTDQLANVGLDTTIFDQLCKKFMSIFPQKSDAFKVSVFLFRFDNFLEICYTLSVPLPILYIDLLIVGRNCYIRTSPSSRFTYTYLQNWWN